MAQKKVWEREYRESLLITKGAQHAKEIARFFRFLRREGGFGERPLRVLDIGSGTGKNANYLASLGHRVVGLELATPALRIAHERALELGVRVDYREQDIGLPYPLADGEFDAAIDVISSNSLDEKERDNYLSETCRVLVTGGYLFVRALCKDGDVNAKALLKHSPGKERDTYVIKELGLIERVFSKDDFIARYMPYFEIMEIEKKTNYTRFRERSYKRNFWHAYLKKLH